MFIIFPDTTSVYEYSYIGGYDDTGTNSYLWIPSNEAVPLGQPYWSFGEPNAPDELHMAYKLDASGRLMEWVDIAGSSVILFICETP